MSESGSYIRRHLESEVGADFFFLCRCPAGRVPRHENPRVRLLKMSGERVIAMPQTIRVYRRNHARKKIDDFRTPQWLFDRYNDLYHFDLDAAASHENHLCGKYFTKGKDALTRRWYGRVWCNPPYSHPNLGRWIDKAWRQAAVVELVVMLVPANRTEQAWWQKHVEPFRDRQGSPLRVEFLPGRMRFIAHNRATVGPNERPPFGCCLLIWQEPD